MSTGFTSVEAINYRSFKHLKINMKRKNMPKHIVAIYGENGAGKSNIVNLFSSLTLSTRTLSNQISFYKFLSKYHKYVNSSKNKSDHISDNFLKDIFGVPARYESIQQCFPNAHMIDAKGPMIICYNFMIHGKKGYYKLIFDNKLNLLDERLNFTIKKAMGRIFEVKNTSNGLYLNRNIFKTKLLRNSIKDACTQYWGKHTLLASFFYVQRKNRNEFTKNNVSNNFLEVYYYFRNISFRSDTNIGSFSGKVCHKSFDLLHHLLRGRMPDNKESRLLINSTASALNDYFLPLYSDMSSLYYKTNSSDGKINYSLWENKKLNNKIVPIPFSMESNGTRRLLGLFTLILNAINGDTVIIDEIDQGIHDLLMNNLITNINDCIKGQLIFTTHDTFLMTALNTPSMYVIQIDPFGRKRVIPISTAVRGRIFNNNNIQKMYLNGFLSGIPYPDDISFESILKDVRKGKQLRHDE